MDPASLPGPSTETTTDARQTKIQYGNTVMLRLPRGAIRCAKIDKDSMILLGRHGSFYANELVGQPYGLTYEIVNKTLNSIAPRTFQEVEDTDATNELINDSQVVQLLTITEIEELKRNGAHVSDIIKRQVEQHANYALKTEFSKEKYKKRKEDKYSKSFTTIEPTPFNICEYWFNKDRNRIRDVRADTLAQMMNLASIRAGGRYLAVDDASGIVVATILDRMGGQGLLITICDVDGPPAYPVVGQMNFNKETISSVLASLSWSTAQEDYEPILAASDPTSSEVKSEKRRARLLKRKCMNDSLKTVREELFAGEFEALIVCSEYDPFTIIETLSPYLAGSASIVVQSPHLQVLADLQSKLRTDARYLAPTLTEGWLRRYQVLPGRTHPLMTMSGSGGYILHTFHVYDEPSAASVSFRQFRPKKRKNAVKVDEPLSKTSQSLSKSPYPATTAGEHPPDSPMDKSE